MNYKITQEITYNGKTGHIFKVFKLQGELGVRWEDGTSSIIKMEWLQKEKENDSKS
jgi:hypothetical protein